MLNCMVSCMLKCDVSTWQSRSTVELVMLYNSKSLHCFKSATTKPLLIQKSLLIPTLAANDECL